MILPLILALSACSGGDSVAKEFDPLGSFGPPSPMGETEIDLPSISLPTIAEIPTSIVLGVEDGWDPFARADGTGMSNEIVVAAYGVMGIDVELVVEPHAQLLKKVESGELLGCFNVAREPATEDLFLWGARSLFVAKAYVYHHVDRPIKGDRPEDLVNGERVGLILGYEYGESLQGNDKIVRSRVRTQAENLEKLVLGRLDATVYFEKVANALLEREGKRGLVVRAFEGTPSVVHVAFSKKNSHSAHFANLLDRGLKIIEENGAHTEIVSGY